MSQVGVVRERDFVEVTGRTDTNHESKNASFPLEEALGVAELSWGRLGRGGASRWDPTQDAALAL